MNIFGLVTARGGSKRLPGKNVLLLGGRPLIAWTLAAARDSGVFTHTLVSTDDPGIAEVARQWGGEVPWLRPAELASDTAGSLEVALHALDWYEVEYGPVDGLMLLQPTSPFRSADTIRRAASLFAARGGRPVVGVSPAASHPAWCFRIDGDRLAPFLGRDELGRRSQDLSPAYALNGAVYLASPATLRREQTFIGEDAIPLLMEDPAETLDIDTTWDWRIAEAVYQQTIDQARARTEESTP